MSNQSSSSRSSSFKPTDNEINELVLKLQALLPLLNQSPNATASTILEETCTYIKNLRREVDSLSGRLSQLLDSAEINDVELIRRFQQESHDH
ncbi:Basic helix-loop-helix transcription factor [Parasponia andersonii]|uniref:Basic helix-loop-helix transcription factor n=1 Tax=Parasponia andersonii TaxID=3476 RepID=A0A2P5C8H5_PARAD|nr:Basic helix-loop-helix transcription factor [Parasponia andersonii]